MPERKYYFFSVLILNYIELKGHVKSCSYFVVVIKCCTVKIGMHYWNAPTTARGYTLHVYFREARAPSAPTWPRASTAVSRSAAAPSKGSFFSIYKYLSFVMRLQGLRHADENGGTGTRRQRIQDFLQRVTHTKN